jgi:hypothetical protein
MMISPLRSAVETPYFHLRPSFEGGERGLRTELGRGAEDLWLTMALAA